MAWIWVGLSAQWVISPVSELADESRWSLATHVGQTRINPNLLTIPQIIHPSTHPSIYPSVHPTFCDRKWMPLVFPPSCFVQISNFRPLPLRPCASKRNRKTTNAILPSCRIGSLAQTSFSFSFLRICIRSTLSPLTTCRCGSLLYYSVNFFVSGLFFSLTWDLGALSGLIPRSNCSFGGGETALCLLVLNSLPSHSRSLIYL